MDLLLRSVSNMLPILERAKGDKATSVAVNLLGSLFAYIRAKADTNEDFIQKATLTAMTQGDPGRSFASISTMTLSSTVDVDSIPPPPPPKKVSSRRSLNFDDNDVQVSFLFPKV